jgi:hypothetical protein
LEYIGWAGVAEPLLLLLASTANSGEYSFFLGIDMVLLHATKKLIQSANDVSFETDNSLICCEDCGNQLLVLTAISES